MANIIYEQKLIDSNKRALVKYILISDGTQQTNTALLDASSLRFSLNANGYIMTSNTDPKSVYGISVKRVFGQVKSGGYVSLNWASEANTPIVVLSSGSPDINFDHVGGALTPDRATANGDILITTMGFAANDSFTLILDINKDTRDYDAGQTADPIAFNDTRFR